MGGEGRGAGRGRGRGGGRGRSGEGEGKPQAGCVPSAETDTGLDPMPLRS